MKKLLSLLFFSIFAIMLGCQNKQDLAKSNSTGDAALENFQINSFSFSPHEEVIRGLCATDDYYYFMTNSQADFDSSPCPVYSYCVSDNSIAEIQLPYWEGWKISNMIETKNGFWMTFSTLDGLSTYLVRVDQNYKEVFHIDMEKYKSPQGNILGKRFKLDNSDVEDMIEAFGYTDVEKALGFFDCSIICDSDERVYITGTTEDVIVFNDLGNYLGRFNIYNYEYDSAVYFTATRTGKIMVVCYNTLWDYYYQQLNIGDYSVSDPIFFEESPQEFAGYASTYHSFPSILPQFELMEYRYDGIYGISIQGKTFTRNLLLDSSSAGLPLPLNNMEYCVGNLTNQIVFSYCSLEGIKEYKFYTIENN